MKYVLTAIAILCSIAIASPQGVPVNTTYVVGTSSVEALAANKNRGYLLIQNNGSDSCWAKFGATQTSREGVVIGAGENYEMVNAYIKSSVYMICGATGSSIVFVESNY